MVEEKKTIGGKVSEFFLHLLTYGGFNSQDGQISLWGNPTLFTPIDAYVTIFREIEKTIGEKIAHKIFYWLGWIYGRNSTLIMMKKYGINKNNISEFIKGATFDGFGYMYIEEYDKTNFKTGTIIGKNSPFATNYSKKFGNTSEGIDYYMSGMLAGGTEPLFGMPYVVKEDKCMACGDSLCRYSITNEKNEEPKFLIKSKITSEILQKRLLSLTLKQNIQLKFFKSKDIHFGDGSFVLSGISGVNTPVYGWVILDKILEKLITNKSKNAIYSSFASEIISSIGERIGGKDIRQDLKVLDIFGFGKFEIILSNSKRIVIDNRSQFSQIYLGIIGRSNIPVELLIQKILEKFFIHLGKKCKVEQSDSITCGKKRNLFIVNFE